MLTRLNIVHLFLNCKIVRRQLPSYHKSVTVIFGWFAIPRLGTQMDGPHYFVDEYDDLLLKALSCVRKLSDATN